MRNNLSRESTACRWRIRGCGICFSGDLTCCCCFGVSVSLGHRWHCGLYLWQATYGRGLRQPAAIPSFQSPVSQFPSFPVSVKQVTSCQYGNYLQGASDPIGGRTGNSPLKLKGDLKYRSNTRRKRGPPTGNIASIHIRVISQVLVSNLVTQPANLLDSCN